MFHSKESDYVVDVCSLREKEGAFVTSLKSYTKGVLNISFVSNLESVVEDLEGVFDMFVSRPGVGRPAKGFP